MSRTTSRTSANRVARTLYSTLAEDERQREVAIKYFGGNVSAAIVARFEDVENLFDVPAYLKPRIHAAAEGNGLSLRDYVVKVFTEHALSLPAAEPRKKPAGKG